MPCQSDQILRALLSPRQVVDALLEWAKFESLAMPWAGC